MITPGHETTAISHQPWDSICVTVRRETLAQWEPPLARLLERKGAPEHGVCIADRRAVVKFAAWTERLFSEQWRAGDEPALWESALSERLQGDLVAMLDGRPSPTPASSLQRVARYDVALSACRIIDADPERRLNVRDVASQVGVGIRALQYAFRNVLGVTPEQYMLATRLSLVRHQLRRASASGSVTSVAFDHQFENLSRFASQYARLFGERPSETLRSVRQASLNA
jgi:AraC-like DNA-binding protein